MEKAEATKAFFEKLSRTIKNVPDPEPISDPVLENIMVAYNKNPKSEYGDNPTQWAHFPLAALATFMKGLGIPGTTTLDKLAQGDPALGMYVNFTQHVDDRDCPKNQTAEYKGRNSVALSFTELDGTTQTWQQKKFEGQHFYLTAGMTIPTEAPGFLSGALDKTELFPPGSKNDVKQRHPQAKFVDEDMIQRVQSSNPEPTA